MAGKAGVHCGVPQHLCSGGSSGQREGDPLGRRKIHADHTQAFGCMVRHLRALGYTQVGSREFRPPDGGPIRTLTKKSRFGVRVFYAEAKTRFMPAGRMRGGFIGSF